MYNYKFSDGVCGVLKNDMANNQDLYTLVNEIRYILETFNGVGDSQYYSLNYDRLSKLFFDYDILNSKFFDTFDNKLSGYDYIKINNSNAFSNEKLSEYFVIDKKFCIDIATINFKISDLNSRKKIALKNLDIKKLIKIDDCLKKLQNDLSCSQLKIDEINNDINSIQIDYSNRLIQFVNDVNCMCDDCVMWSDVVKRYGIDVIEDLKYFLIILAINNYLKCVKNSSFEKCVESKDISEVLGLDVNELKKVYYKNVGTNCKPCN